MKKILILLIFLLPGVLTAQSGFIGTLGTGISLPTGDLATDNLGGVNIHGSGGYVINKTFTSRLHLQYNKFPLDEKYSDVTGGQLTIFTIKADFLAGNFEKKSKVVYYGLGGIGVHFVGREDLIVSGIRFKFESETDLGLGFGGGIGVKLSNSIAVFGEVKYDMIFSSNKTYGYIPITAGVMFLP